MITVQPYQKALEHYHTGEYASYKNLRAWQRMFVEFVKFGYSQSLSVEVEGYTHRPARKAWADYCDLLLEEEQAAKGIL